MPSYYVEALAGGGGVGSKADPWTWGEFKTAESGGVIAAGDTIYVKADANYSDTGFTAVQNGSDAAPIRLIGYGTTEDDKIKPTIVRSGGVADMMNFDGNFNWIVENFIIDGQSSGGYNFRGEIKILGRNIESKDAGGYGFRDGTFLNCYAHGSGSNQFAFAFCLNCTADGEGVSPAGFDRCYVVNCISKNHTSYNISVRQDSLGTGNICLNCISDGGTGEGIYAQYGSIILNCIVVNCAAGHEGINFTSDSCMVNYINFHSNDSDSNFLARIVNYTTHDPQFKDAASLDYRIQNPVLCGLGFSNVGMVGVDYAITPGVDQVAITLPDDGKVISPTVFGFDADPDAGEYIKTVVGDVRKDTAFGDEGTEIGTMAAGGRRPRGRYHGV